MQIIARYVLLDYLLVFFIALVVAAGLLLFVGAMLDLPPDIGGAEMLLMMPYLVPEAIRNAMQAAALFAACSVFGRLAASNELLALSSLGISPFKVIRPVLLVATLLSLSCVWLYDLGESWGQKGIHRVLVDSAEAIAYRFLRTKRSYSKGHVALNVKVGRGTEIDSAHVDHGNSRSARTGHRVGRRRRIAHGGPRTRFVDRDAQRHGLHRQRGFDGLSGHDGASRFFRPGRRSCGVGRPSIAVWQILQEDIADQRGDHCRFGTRAADLDRGLDGRHGAAGRWPPRRGNCKPSASICTGSRPRSIAVGPTDFFAWPTS